jgi:hypothetical protein
MGCLARPPESSPSSSQIALSSSPASIASFLEAAGSAALEEAGKILVRRT